MPNNIAPIVEELRNLGKAIEESSTHETTLRDNYGWNFPNLNKNDIADIAYSLAEKLEKIDTKDVDPGLDVLHVSVRIQQITSEVASNLWNGQGSEAFRVYSSLLAWVDSLFQPLYVYKVDWEALAKADQMPSELARKARALSARLKAVTASVSNLDEQLRLITAAHEAALALPTDLESLSDARAAIVETGKEVEKNAATISASAATIKSMLEEINAHKDEAEKLVHRTEDAYSAATTIGLGASFEARAKSLAKSMWVWVGGLFVALIAGGGIGWLRFSHVEQLIKNNASATAIWTNTMLSALSIAAPVWLAWVATKQIGQRFRLSEDYAFKSSVAKAYEGYRREAGRLDPAFANRLFESALERLDEAPLRFVEHESYGSPWHEAIGLRKLKSKASSLGQKRTSAIEKQELPIGTPVETAQEGDGQAGG